MLKFKERLSSNASKSLTQIPIYKNKLYIEDDGSFISGYTLSEYSIIDKQDVYLNFGNNNKYHKNKILCKNVVRQGFLKHKIPYSVNRYNNSYYIRYNDGFYYFSTEKDGNKCVITINGKDYAVDEKTEYINVETIFYIEDSKLYFCGNEYEIIIDFINGTESYDGEIRVKENITIPYTIYNKNEWKNLIKFIITKSQDLPLTIDEISCVKKVQYIKYGNNGGEKYYMTYNEKEKNYTTTVYDGENKKIEIKQKKLNTNDYTNVAVDEKGDLYDIFYEWKNVVSSDRINIYIDGFVDLSSGQKIIAKSINPLSTRCYVNEDESQRKYIDYCGGKYIIENNEFKYFLKIPKEENRFDEYELFVTNLDLGDGNNTYYYYIKNETPYLVSLDDKKLKATVIHMTSYGKVIKPSENDNNIVSDNKNDSYDVAKYNYVKLKGEEYIVKVYKDGKKTIEYVDVNRVEEYSLTIEENISKNTARCRVDTDEEGDESGIVYMIKTNADKFEFKLKSELLPSSDYSIDSSYNRFLGIEKFSDIVIYNPISYLTMPINLSVNVDNSVLKDDIVKNGFFDEEIKKALNPIVDMERDIYYPSIKTNNGFELINELVFDLHFRTRNLEDWKITEDSTEDAKHSKQDESIVDNDCNWNIFDYYNWSGEDVDKVTNKKDLRPKINCDTVKYYQPSDLLYFLNFDDDDVFYQKSKIGKSFLRLSFFDSNDPINQSLLHTATIFMNENKYYKSYIDNIAKSNKYVSVVKDDDMKTPITSDSISVRNETCDEIGELEKSPYATFEEDKRLGASINVTNRYESQESAEGFYLYIFKDYSSSLHDRTIYMKVEFNHAGEGRVINFMTPYIIDGTDKKMIDMSVDDNRKEFMKGYSIKDMYKRMFIEVNVKYDEKNRRYVYFFPNYLMEHQDKKDTVRFNLYEIKLKDESYKPNKKANF